MKTPFLQLKKQWGLNADISIDALLNSAKDKLKNTPHNPELLYTVAELYRHTGDINQAEKYYQQAVDASDFHTQQRAEKLTQRITSKRDNTRAKLLLLTFIPLIAVLLGAGLAWHKFSQPEPIPTEKFAFTQWLAKQQMSEIITTLQAENPELTFDFSRSASTQSPMEFMQNLMKPDAIEKLKRDQKNSSEGDEDGGPPAFQCSVIAPVNCAAADVPRGAGEKRREVVLLIEAYTSVLDKEKDCDKLEESIESIGQQLQWRKSESDIKSNLENLTTECYFKQKNVEKTLEHARKLQCAGDIGYINSIYWYSAAITKVSGDTEKAYKLYQCFQEATKYGEDNNLFSSSYRASLHRESGALAWLYFDELETASRELKKGREILKKLPRQTPSTMEVIGAINLDLMETYVSANVGLDTFNELLEEVNTSGRLTDGYKQIKDTLSTIYYMQNNKHKMAQITLQNVIARFKAMPEYVCSWDWSGFKRGLKTSITDDTIRKHAITLVETTNCYIPQTTEKRLQRINAVSKFLKEQ